MIQRAATKISNCRRGQLARGIVGGKRSAAGAAANAMEAAVIKVQKAWRHKLMWRKIIGFKKKMTKGGMFTKYTTGGAAQERQVYCNDRMTEIYWRKKGSSFAGSSIKVDDVKAVVMG